MTLPPNTSICALSRPRVASRPANHAPYHHYAGNALRGRGSDLAATKRERDCPGPLGATRRAGKRHPEHRGFPREPVGASGCCAG
jgi:hypothetical protein